MRFLLLFNTDQKQNTGNELMHITPEGARVRLIMGDDGRNLASPGVLTFAAGRGGVIHTKAIWLQWNKLV